MLPLVGLIVLCRMAKCISQLAVVSQIGPRKCIRSYATNAADFGPRPGMFVLPGGRARSSACDAAEVEKVVDLIVG